MRRLLIRGSGEVGSAIAQCAFREGFAVLVHDVVQPLTSRRRMAFSDALFDGEAVLDGVLARRIDRVAECMTDRPFVAICCLPLDECLAAFAPDVLVDARMRKRVVPESQRGLAPLVIGVGPNFTAGRQVHLAVESAYGEALGTVIDVGSTQVLAGEPRAVLGHGRERFIYAPFAASFRTERAIGNRVEAGDTLGRLATQSLRAPMSGAIRGLVRDGVRVPAGTKLAEIDPRGENAQISGAYSARSRTPFRCDGGQHSAVMADSVPR